MECIKYKKFLFWEWKAVEHNYKMYRISKFMKCSDDFHIEYKCSVCSASYTERYVKLNELILLGIPTQSLLKVDDCDFYYF